MFTVHYLQAHHRQTQFHSTENNFYKDHRTALSQHSSSQLWSPPSHFLKALAKAWKNSPWDVGTLSSLLTIDSGTSVILRFWSLNCQNFLESFINEFSVLLINIRTHYVTTNFSTKLFYQIEKVQKFGFSIYIPVLLFTFNLTNQTG